MLSIVTSMLAMGMSLTVPQVVGPLKNARLVIVALAANFVLVGGVLRLLILLPIAKQRRRRQGV